MGIIRTNDGVGVSEAHPLPTALTGSENIGHGEATVTTAGNRVQLPDVACSEVTITAKRGNTGYIYAGGAAVSSTSYGKELDATESLTLRVANLDQIWLDASVNGEGVTYLYV